MPGRELTSLPRDSGCGGHPKKGAWIRKSRAARLGPVARTPQDMKASKEALLMCLTKGSPPPLSETSLDHIDGRDGMHVLPDS